MIPHQAEHYYQRIVRPIFQQVRRPYQKEPIPTLRNVRMRNGCLSPRTAVTLIIDAKPVAPIVSDETICEAGTVTDIVLAGGVGSDFTLTGTGGQLPVLQR